MVFKIKNNSKLCYNSLKYLIILLYPFNLGQFSEMYEQIPIVKCEVDSFFIPSYETNVILIISKSTIFFTQLILLFQGEKMGDNWRDYYENIQMGPYNIE